MQPASPPLDRAKVRRQALLLLAVVNALTLAIGVVASVDLRRLHTPQGTALRWLEADVFGQCDDYLTFSVAAMPETRSRAELCRDVRTATEATRAQALRIGLTVRSVTRTGNDATVGIDITRDGVPTPVTVHLVRRDGSWRVLRDAITCGSVGCR